MIGGIAINLFRPRGHRSVSFYLEDQNEGREYMYVLSQDALSDSVFGIIAVEIRARQRTFDGAYARGALADLGYGVTILRLFDKRFSQSDN